MKISVLGCGRWGSFIAWYLDKIGNYVYSWGLADAPEFQSLEKTRKNEYLSFSDTTIVTSDLKAAVEHGSILVISISAQQLRNFMHRLSFYDLSDKTIILCMKGIDEESGGRLSQIVSMYIDKSKTSLAVWVGPGHPQDFMKGIPNCMVIDSEDYDLKASLVESFSSDLIRFYIGNDLIGTEVGAAAKNVVGIAAGMLDGLNYTSLKGALMARGTREIARLIAAMGGKEMSAYGLCHLGDYEATLFSPYSHNRQFGEKLIRGEKFEKLAEGVSTTRALVFLGEEYSVDLPIVKAVNDVVTHNKDPKTTLSNLFIRSIKTEF